MTRPRVQRTIVHEETHLRKFLDFSLPGSECSTGAKVLSMVFSLSGTKVLQRNEKASYTKYYHGIRTHDLWVQA